MGFVDAIDIADKKLTIQTEFFPKPNPRAETKVYLGGALKKVYNEDLSQVPAEDMQRAIGEIHKNRMHEIVEGLRSKLK